ncbi:MAG: peptidylprolyl isomerase [bacterium]|nr:peptidylprolyl isomerase [bacterium]
MKNIIIFILFSGIFFGGFYWWQHRDIAAISGDTAGDVTIKTNMGDIVVELFSADAPKTVENFVTLARNSFYTNTKFHRIIPDFMIQGGDPNSKDMDWSDDGRGGPTGPGYPFADEINKHKLVRGALAMANSGPNTNGSQFFIVTKEATPWIDGNHTVFGRVVSGMDVVIAIERLPRDTNDHPLSDVVIVDIIVE